MSFVIASPEALLAAATDLAAIRSTIRAANAAAAVPTTGALAPPADEVSAGIAALFGAQARAIKRSAPRRRRFMTGSSNCLTPVEVHMRAPRLPTRSRTC
ncbi:PE family protein [Mycobacterium tuberculosis]|nr:PE family protein [Mycobacterium tuberculosis]